MYSHKHFLSFPGKARQQILEQICLGVNRDICRATALGHTSLMYHYHFAAGQVNITHGELVETFQRKFPHCAVDGGRVKGILIDWS